MNYKPIFSNGKSECETGGVLCKYAKMKTAAAGGEI